MSTSFKMRKSMKKPVKSSRPADPLLPAAEKLKEAERLRQAKKFKHSKRLCEELVRDFPDYVGALHTLGLVLADMQQYESAASVLSKAAMLCPKDWRVHAALSGVNLKLNRADTAITNLEQAQQLKPGDLSLIGTLAEIYKDQKEYELAAECFEKIGEKEGFLKELVFSLAVCYEHLGRLDKVHAIYEALLKQGICTVELVLGLAQLPQSLASDDVFSLLDKISDLRPEHEFALHYARAFGFHLAGEYEDAWRELVAANEPQKRKMSEEWESNKTTQQNMLEWARSIPTLKGATNAPQDQPISLFILGPSRSGKTTLERLVGTLPSVKRGYENPIVENSVRRTMQVSGCLTRSVINGMPPGLDPEFRDHYFEELDRRAADASVFTNTHPSKILEVFRYARSIPGARFLFVRRNTYDLILRTYMKNYAKANAYAYDVKTIKMHMDWYYAMINLCAEKLPRISHVVDYDDIISDPSSILKAAADLCGLDVTTQALPELGDDRGVGAPYRGHIEHALRS